MFENYENPICLPLLILKMKYNDSNLTLFFVKKYWKYHTNQDRWKFWSNAFNPMLIYVWILFVHVPFSSFELIYLCKTLNSFLVNLFHLFITWECIDIFINTHLIINNKYIFRGQVKNHNNRNKECINDIWKLWISNLSFLSNFFFLNKT